MGTRRAAMAAKIVDLPLPFAPINPYLRPRVISRVVSLTSSLPKVVTAKDSILTSIECGCEPRSPVTTALSNTVPASSASTFLAAFTFLPLGPLGIFFALALTVPDSETAVLDATETALLTKFSSCAPAADGQTSLHKDATAESTSTPASCRNGVAISLSSAASIPSVHASERYEAEASSICGATSASRKRISFTTPMANAWS
mmetsp:Transcript_19956/g.48604  ORF Transcript_19956/g.48604 Transcript_19956/m.48604 type:complete len:203 (-) Transcript_19956:16-624(-)